MTSVAVLEAPPSRIDDNDDHLSFASTIDLSSLEGDDDHDSSAQSSRSSQEDVPSQPKLSSVSSRISEEPMMLMNRKAQAKGQGGDRQQTAGDAGDSSSSHRSSSSHPSSLDASTTHTQSTLDLLPHHKAEGLSKLSNHSILSADSGLSNWTTDQEDEDDDGDLLLFASANDPTSTRLGPQDLEQEQNSLDEADTLDSSVLSSIHSSASRGDDKDD